MTDRLNVSKVISEDAIDETTRSLGTSDAGISETARVHESSKSAHIRLRKDSEPGVTRKDDSNANTANAGGESPNRKLKDAVNVFMSLKKRSTFLHDSSVKDDPQDTAERRGSLRAQMISGHYDGASFSHNRTHRDELNIENLRRLEYEKKPMSTWERRKLAVRKWLGRKSNLAGDDQEKSTQIYIPPNDQADNVLAALRQACHLSFHDIIVWQINTSYLCFFTFVLVCYLLWVNSFALLLFAAINWTWDGAQTQCITTFDFEADQPVQDFHENMEFAFELSWTTFSTVGYGAISPAGGHSGCYWIRYICAIEAFVGVIYFGFSGAIFFAKINRILSRAPVTFTSTLCVQYDVNHLGNGPVNKNSSSTPAKFHGDNSFDVEAGVEFPIIEFRIVNNKANEKGWEILDAEVKCMVSIDVATHEISKCKKDTSEIFSMDFANDGSNTEIPVSKQTFHKLELEAESHPYFKRVWYCRHTLDGQSPLVRREVRREIRSTGRWPLEKSNHVGVRASLVKFNTIITTMKGTLNTTSNGVFIEKRYKYENICIGYKHAGLLYLSDSKTAKGEKQVKIDLALIHDIVPQQGGGAEPLDKTAASSLLLRAGSNHNGRRGSGLKIPSFAS